MPFYYPIKKWDTEDRNRTIHYLSKLRKQKQEQIPTRTLKKSLLLATWNIRDLGNEDKRAQDDGSGRPGPRLEESYYYIAEIISAFDVVSVQEVNSLRALEKVMDILGPSWDHMTTDINPAKGGNEERMTFIYDTRKVRFNHTVGQVVSEGHKQFVRTPYYAAFQSGWFKFSLCNVHILYGNYRDTRERVREIDEIAEFLSERVDRTGENIILLGDFNILSQEDETFEPLIRHGWAVPMDHLTNVTKSKGYDQIAFKVKPEELMLGPSEPNSGAFDFFASLFPDDKWEDYYKIAKKTGRPMDSWDSTLNWPAKDRMLTREEYYRQWRTWQVSDHMPLWVELEIDFTEAYLTQISKG
ncbi:endonuclease/exonuclease/phosphatase family protein [uncultured Ruegeria sp.]|uniref:endonuclease/exonuclease/phosphatase family protein n=1 Tax=uncultured Ruegeria sp. TaxID=259304 RepID=UPI00262D64B4|nr:endonuclease/exonuclease/phosphatase family protein [uncultured Ruegeria sp.]